MERLTKRNSIEFVCNNFKLIDRDFQKEALTDIYYTSPGSICDFNIGEKKAIKLNLDQLDKKQLRNLILFIEEHL